MALNRDPRGTPTGGQFAAGTHSEADVDLLLADMGLEELDATEAVAIAETASVRHAARSPKLDAAEMSQDTLAEFYKARRNAREKVWDAHANGRTVKPGAALANPGAYINVVADGIAQRHITGETQSADRTAIKQFAHQRNEAESRLGRELTSAEKDEMADRIRTEQPPGRRAKVGFHLPRGETTILENDFGSDTTVDRPVGADGTDWATGTTDSSDFEAGTLGDELLVSLAEGRKGAAQNARRKAWDAVAVQSGAAPVSASSISETDAAEARATVAAAGGIAALCDRWSDETASPQQVNALFTPFGGRLDSNGESPMSYTEQERVVRVLRGMGAYADDVFNGAVSGATLRREKVAA